MLVPNEMQGFALAASAFLLQLGVSMCQFPLKCKGSLLQHALVCCSLGCQYASFQSNARAHFCHRRFFVAARGVNMSDSNEIEGFASAACAFLLQLGVSICNFQ